MLKKYCSKCKRNLEIRFFSRDSSRIDGFNNRCRECFHFINKLSNKRNRQRALKNRRDWRIANKEKTQISRKLTYNKYKYDFDSFIQYLHKRMRQRIYYKDTYKGLPICSKDEFIALAKNNEVLKNLFDNWVKSGNNLHIKPSVDRIVNERGYVIDNIQFLTWMENTLKG